MTWSYATLLSTLQSIIELSLLEKISLKKESGRRKHKSFDIHKKLAEADNINKKTSLSLDSTTDHILSSASAGCLPMSATIISDPVMVSAPETQPSSAKLISQTEIEFANCDCCGLTEECTPAYIERVRKRYNGKWLCGLCAEAVKDEVVRNDRMIGIEEALDRHMNFCNKVRSPGPPPDPTELLISAMRHILRRSFDSSRTLRSTPNSPHSKDGALSDSILTRSESCFPTFSG